MVWVLIGHTTDRQTNIDYYYIYIDSLAQLLINYTDIRLRTPINNRFYITKKNSGLKNSNFALESKDFFSRILGKYHPAFLVFCLFLFSYQAVCIQTSEICQNRWKYALK